MPSTWTIDDLPDVATITYYNECVQPTETSPTWDCGIDF